jgi:hypothetical protein
MGDRFSIFEDIESGIWDEGIDAIIEAAVARRNFLRDIKGANNKINFVPGTNVRVINIRPKYLTGITGFVSARQADRRGDLMIEVDQHHWPRLGRYSRTLSVPASSLEEV